MLLPELPAVAVPVRVAPAVAVELPVRERIAGPLGALGTAVPVLLVRRLVQLSFGETNKHPRTAVPVLLVRRLVLLPPAATVAALQAVATWSAVAFAELPFAEQPEPGPVRVEQAVATEPLEQGQGIVAAASFAGRVRPVQLGALVPTVVHLPELAIAEQPVQQQGAGVQIAG